MSAYPLAPLDGAPAGRAILIGWDAPLSTFFVHVWDQPDTGDPIDHVWAGGSPYDVSEVDTVLELAAPYTALPAGLRERLLADRAAEGDGFAGRPGYLG